MTTSTWDTGWDDIGWAPPEDVDEAPARPRITGASIDNWAAGDLLSAPTDPPHEYLEPGPLHHARLSVADQGDPPRMVAELLLMLGLANDAGLQVEPFTPKNPEERKHK